MPVNTSLISGTQAHKHSSPSSDGGLLDDNVTGVTGTTTGSMLVYDASSIAQNLSIGNAADVLTVSGGTAAWVAAGSPATPDLQLVGSEVVSGGAVSDVTHTFSNIPCADISSLLILFTGQCSSATNIGCRMNTISTSTYNSKGWYNFATCDWDCSNYVNTDSYQCGRSEIGTSFRINLWVYSNDSTQMMIFNSQAAGSAGAENLGGWNSTTGITGFTEVSMIDNSGTNRFQNGTRLDIYRYNV